VEATFKTWNKKYKKGFFSYIILLLLKDCALYGIEINNKLLEITDSKVTFQESGTYRTAVNNLLSKHFPNLC